LKILERWAAALLTAALILSMTPPVWAAADSEAVAAENLYQLGLFQGTGTNLQGGPEFSLERQLSREEAVVLLIRLLGKEGQAQSQSWSSPFGDVDGWAKNYVGYAYQKGLTYGVSANRLGAKDTVTNDQFLTFLLRALGYEDGNGEDFSWQNASSYAAQLGMDIDLTRREITRGEAAVAAYAGLQQKLKGGQATLCERLILQGAADLDQAARLTLYDGPHSSSLAVDYLDIGQGDSILIRDNGKTMLIDAGTADSEETLLSDLQARGITTIDVLLATHPHADHIGSMAAVLQNLDVKQIYMTECVHTTATFERLLDAIEEKGLQATQAKAGQRFTLGNAQILLLAANNGQKDMNNNSIVLRLTHEGNKFLFTGDASAEEEKILCGSGYSLRADVLKVGHHGSATSSSRQFLEAVRPEDAVISVGAGNTYGHPAKTVLSRLSAIGAKIYRTDQQGTVTASSTAAGVQMSTER
jgi:competence protein ComEC